MKINIYDYKGFKWKNIVDPNGIKYYNTYDECLKAYSIIENELIKKNNEELLEELEDDIIIYSKYDNKIPPYYKLIKYYY